MPLAAQSAPPAPPVRAAGAQRLAAFEEAARRQMAVDHTTGLAIAFYDGDSVWSRAFGLADVENGSPMKPESSFRLASITKPMTAIAVTQLEERGKIDFDAEIQTYVPYFPRKKYPITVRQLLGHLGGIPHYKNPERELHIKEHRNTREAIAIFQDFDLVAEPGTQFNYTTYGFNLLGAAIEGASGQSYGDYMREHVWGPLDMKNTRMDDPRAIVPNRVRGYEWGGGELRNSEYVDVSSRFAGGGTRTTVLDLLKFARGFIDGKLVSKPAVDQMLRPMTLRDGHSTDYGMGWGVDPQNGRFVAAHSGAQNETRTMLFILPARHMAVAAATNFESGDLFWYVRALVMELLGERWDASGGADAYLPGKADRVRFAAARGVFNYGLAAYERRGGAITEDPEKLRNAFAYLNRCVGRPDVERGPDAARDGIHPVAGEPLSAAGSFMAKTLADRGGEARLEDYHASGPMAFFADYVEAYAHSSSFPRALRFEPDFVKRIQQWNRDWSRTFGEISRSPSSTASWGLEPRRLRREFAGASIYPDLASDFGEIVRQHSLEDDREGALEVAGLAHELYPELAAPAVSLAAAQIAFGDSSRARAQLEAARRLENGEAATSGRALNRIAYELAELNRLEGATALLRIAAEMHPREANLYDSLGELELKSGHREASIAAYRKALEIDPKLESATRALESLEKPKP